MIAIFGHFGHQIAIFDNSGNPIAIIGEKERVANISSKVSNQISNHPTLPSIDNYPLLPPKMEPHET